MTLNQYMNYNFGKIILLIFMIITAIYLFSCTPEPVKEIDEDFMEKYVKRAEAKFRQDSINQGLIKSK